MMHIQCPYCRTLYETEIHELEPEVEFTEEECPSCGNLYAFEYYLEPTILNVRKLGEAE